MTSSPALELKADRSGTDLAPADAAAAAKQRSREHVRVRNTIAARLMRMACDRLGGCTRACRRQKRCVAADAVERENDAL